MDWKCYDFEMLYRNYPKDRVFLGGAAHYHLPPADKTSTSDFRKLYNLGWKLAAVICGAPESLDTYQTERIDIAKSVAKSTTLLFFANTGPELEMRRAMNKLPSVLKPIVI